MYNIYMNPKGIDAMPLSQFSGGCWPGPNPQDWIVQRIQENRKMQIQEEQDDSMRDDAVDDEEFMGQIVELE